MSAYGAIQRAESTTLLATTIWPVGNSVGAEASRYATIHHLTLTLALQCDGLLDYLHSAFSEEVEGGLTYPQEGEMNRTAFEAYFFAADVFVAIISSRERHVNTPGTEVDIGVEQARGGRSWDICIAGFYYVKPNYPGRSSHICNAGFVVPSNTRGLGNGSLLALSYLHYAPKLGYKASVFNLVYVNNVASIRLWEKLGFAKAGRIPNAGRLKKRNGQGEEFVDAWVFYKSFVEETPALAA